VCGFVLVFINLGCAVFGLWYRSGVYHLLLYGFWCVVFWWGSFALGYVVVGVWYGVGGSSALGCVVVDVWYRCGVIILSCAVFGVLYRGGNHLSWFVWFLVLCYGPNDQLQGLNASHLRER